MKHLFTSLVTSVLVFVSVNMAFSTTFTVTNLNNSGAGSLRQAMTDANAAGPGTHLIDFDASLSGPVNITSSLPTITNANITIDGDDRIILNGPGGDVNITFFTISASGTEIRGFDLQNIGGSMFYVLGGLSNVIIEDMFIQSTTGNFINQIVRVVGASTNMTIRNITSPSGMQDCYSSEGGRAFYFQSGTQTNLLLEDINVFALCEGIVFRDASVNNLDIINATIYNAYNAIVFDNTGGPVETANDVVIDGENTASLYQQRDGGGSGMIYSDFVNTNWMIKNLEIDGDRANTTNDANYGIRFDNQTNGITLDNVTMNDAEVYGLWFNNPASNITIQNSTFTNLDGWTDNQMIRFENTVNGLTMTNVDIDLDLANTTNDGNYGVVFLRAVTNATLDDVTINEADVDGLHFNLGTVDGLTVENSTFTNNYDGVEFYNGYIHDNIVFNNNTFTGQTRSSILVHTGSATNDFDITNNNMMGGGSHAIWLYSGNGNKEILIMGNEIAFNGGAGIYNNGPETVNITENSIYRNSSLGIDNVGGNLSYENTGVAGTTDVPTITGSVDNMDNTYDVTFTLPANGICASGCDVEIFANESSDDAEGHYYVGTYTVSGTASSHTVTVPCALPACQSEPYGFWTATLKVNANGNVSEFSNRKSMQLQGPAAVKNGIALWLDAQDATSGNFVNNTGWLDRSGNDRDVDNVVGDPNRSTGGLNYNHYVAFDGNDYFRTYGSQFHNAFTEGEAIVITRAYYRHVNQGFPYDFGGNSNGHYSWGNQHLYNDFGTNDRFGYRPDDYSIADGKAGISVNTSATRRDIRAWNIFDTYSASTANGGWGTGFNGQFMATTATNTTNFGGTLHIGAVAGYVYYGDIAEVILYQRKLTTAERHQVNSYLAIKYGITLEQSETINEEYIASDGTTKMWENDGDGYEWDVLGVARDDMSPLYQKQSTSVNPGEILTVAVGAEVAATNEDNGATIANNLSFLTFASNNGIPVLSNTITGLNSNFRMDRAWKVDKVNFANTDVTLQFGQEFSDHYLIISTSADFSSGNTEAATQLDENGAVTINSSQFNHGSFFTLGAKIQAPGCIQIPMVAYPNYAEYYQKAGGQTTFDPPTSSGYITSLSYRDDAPEPLFSGVSATNLADNVACDECGFIYRTRINITTAGTYTFFVTSDDNGEVLVDGDYVAGVVTCCYTETGTKYLDVGWHDIEARQTEGGGGDYLTVQYQGPSVAKQTIPFTVLEAAPQAPGVLAWLKGDFGVTENNGVTKWRDASGNGNFAYQTTQAYNPTYNSGNAINFNPAVTAVGDEGLLFRKNIPGTNNLNIFAVGTPTATHGNWNTLLRGYVDDHPIMLQNNANNQFGYYDNNNGLFKGSGINLSTAEPALMGMLHNAAANTAQTRINGKTGNVLNNIDENDPDYIQHLMNGNWRASNQSWGDLGEIFMVAGTLSANDIQKIESYLAFKYGITLDQSTARDYLSTNASTKMWVNDDPVFVNDIAGIGRDDCQDLNQKQSKSQNSDALVTFAVGGSIAESNADNASNITNDLSFFSWANNNGTTNSYATEVNVASVSANQRIERVWKVDELGNWTDDVTLRFGLGNAETYLLISNDPTFAAGVTEYLLDAAGDITLTDAQIENGNYFTFAKQIIGPACVDAGIAAWWRADQAMTQANMNLLTHNWFLTGNVGYSATTGNGRATYNAGNTSANGRIEQYVTTAPGSSYNFEYRVGRNGGGGGTVRVTVEIVDSTTNAILATATIAKNRFSGATSHSLQFDATGATTLVRVKDASSNTVSIDIWVDNMMLGVPQPWRDFSGNEKHASQVISSRRPELTDAVINFNPAYDFDGADDWLSSSSLFTATGINNAQIFAVAITDQVKNQSLFAERSANNYYLNAHVPWSDGIMYWDAPYGYRITAGWGGTVGTPYMWSFLRSPTNMSAYRDSRRISNSNAARALIAGNNQPFGIGGAGAGNFNGKIGEMIVYNNSANTTEADRQKIQSYLALKYGITQYPDNDGNNISFQATNTQGINEGDYVAPDGTVYWDASANQTYHNDVAGIGREDCTYLDQKQTKSINTGAWVTMALGDVIATTNAENATDFSGDGEYLIFGHNNLAKLYDVPFSGPGSSNIRMARVWKVQKTGAWSGNPQISIVEPAAASRSFVIASDAAFTNVIFEGTFGPGGKITFPSSEFPIGESYFTFATRVGGPACVDDDIVAWLRADQGVNGFNWTDFSGKNNNPTIGSSDPEVTDATINFHPAFYYDGNDGHILPASAQVSGEYSIFTVAQMEGTQNGRVFQSTGGNTLVGYWGGYEEQLHINGWVSGPYGTVATKDVNMYSLQRSTSGAYQFIDANRVVKAGASLNSQFMRLTLGGANGCCYEPSKVYIPEVAVYDKDLTPVEVNRIESYFAIKYGVTLDQTTPTDYLAAEDGTTIAWDASENTGYGFDIAGLGKDDCTLLHQKQSKSQNDDALVTIALGDVIQPTQNENLNEVTNDLSFFMWSNNGGVSDFATTLATTTVSTTRYERVWKVEKTANWDDQEIVICFDGQSDDSYFLISDSDEAFSTVSHEYQLDVNGCYTLNSDELADASYFTLGKELLGPACVNGGIKMWLRADQGTSTTLNGLETENWADASNNGTDAERTTVANQPILKLNGINYNQTLTFDGNDSYDLSNLAELPYGNPDISVFTVAKSDNSGGWRYIFAYGNNTTNQGYFVGKVLNTTQLLDGGWGNSNTTNNVWNNGDIQLIGSTHSSTTNEQKTYVDGVNVTNGTRAYNLVQDDGYIGSQTYDSPTEFWLGDISEVVVYNRVVSDMERQQINSYLALKYGITLDQTTATDYLASDGSTTMWDASDNVGFDNDIAGIGKDVCTALDQKQSKSINTGTILSVAVGGALEASNSENFSVIPTDRSFFTWGNNGLGIEFTAAIDLSGQGHESTARMERIWKVDKTNWTDQNITICVEQAGERYLLVDTDGDADFADEAATKEYTFGFGTGCVTLNSSEIPDGANITIATKIVGPACVNDDIRMWLRADYGASVAGKWNDFSGNSNNTSQTVVAQQPVVIADQLNFNPALDFDGSNDVLVDADGILGSSTYSDANVFIVTTRDVQQLSSIIQEGNNTTTNYFNIHLTWNNSNIYWHAGNATAGNTLNFVPPSVLNGQPYMYSFTAKTGVGQSVYQNGTLIGSDATMANYTGNNRPMYVGQATLSGGYYYNGKIAEIAIYTGDITATERQNIESYLALKYGFTLDQTSPRDYTASDWDGSTGTKMWTAADNVGYDANIVGIGKDDCADLHQKQSKSQNDDAILTIATGSVVETTNVANTNEVLADMSFFVLGQNSGTTDFSTTLPMGTGTTSTTHLGRVWKVDKTNWTDQDITLCFDGFTDEATYFLLSNTEEDFSVVDQEQVLDANGCITLNTNNIEDGAYISLGKELLGPACVNGGIKLWLRADDGILVSGDLTNGTGWEDFSNNDEDFTAVSNDPAKIETGLNFNPFVEFDGNDYLSKASIVNDFSQAEVFGVLRTRSYAGHGFAFGGESNAHYRTNDTYENFGTTDRIGWRNSNGAILDGHPGLVINNSQQFVTEDWNVYNVFTAPNDWAASFNGYVKAKTNNNTVNFYNETNFIGRGEADFLNGDVGEVIVYNRKLSAAERQQVNSYLAIKYGITLTNDNDADSSPNEMIAAGINEGDYVATDGTTIFWDATANATYHYDIAGIGKDECTNLHQKQSKSVNSDAMVTIAIGDEVKTSNAENANEITEDNSFLMWANNNGSTSFEVDVSAQGFDNTTVHMGRIWKVQTTNFDNDTNDLTLCFDQNGERYLLIDNDDDSFDFATTMELSLDFTTGCITLLAGQLPNGAHFTLGTKISGPACVNASIQAWYRADYGATPTQWADFSGNTVTATQAAVASQPVKNDAAVNYNPAMMFDGSNDFYSIPPALQTGFPSGDEDRTIFVAGSDNSTGLQTIFDFGNNANSQNQSWRFENGSILYIGWANDFYGLNSYSVNAPFIAMFDHEDATQITTVNTFGRLSATSNRTYNTSLLDEARIGSRTAAGEYWNGPITEIVIYDRKLDPVEAQRVNSYLALKYGMTLSNDTDGDTTPDEELVAASGVFEGDYISVAGTVYWDASANTVYHNDIAGLGRDDCTELNQKQSKSQNSDAIVRMAMGSTFETSNMDNAIEISGDNSFFVWGNNNGVTDFNAVANGVNLTARWERVWKVQQTNWGGQDVTVCFDYADIDDDDYLIIDNDAAGDFMTVESEYALDADGCVTFPSSDIVSGGYFTVGKLILGPACVNAGVKVWLRADDGTASGAQWDDYSNNGEAAIQASAPNQPSFTANAINFNPALTHSGATQFMENTTASLLSNTSATMIAVVDQNAYTTWGGVFSYNRTGNRGRPIITNTDVNNTIGANNTGTSGVKAHVTTPNPGFLIRVEYAAGPNIVTAASNGGEAIDTEPTWAQSGSLPGYYVGRHNEGGSYFNGNISEVISYNRVLTPVEVQKVESYLALKYGLTLDSDPNNNATAFETPNADGVHEGDYVATDGTVYWDASANMAYHNDIAGIGRDSCTGLYQKQSKSVNSDALVTMALGTSVTATNATNTGTLVDGAFMLWGNNDGAVDFDQLVSYPTQMLNATNHMARIWTVQKTAWTDQDITLCVGQTGERYLLVDEGGDADFADDTETKEYAFNFGTGCITMSSANLPDGANFSVATVILGPACVNAGIQMWLRADYAASGSSWIDYSGNGVNAAQGTAASQALVNNSGINFNPALDFDGSNDYMTIPNAQMGGFPFGNSARTLIGVGKVDVNGDLNMFSYGTNATSQTNSLRVINQQAVYEGWGNNVDGTASSFPIGQSKIFTGRFDGTTATLELDGSVNASANKSTWNTNSTRDAQIGRFTDNGRYWNGLSSEIIVYDRELTTAELQRVNSYLALKYGITLDQTVATDYLDSDGGVYWDASDNAGYDANIIGIGKDECTALNQKQSKSVNSDAILTVALGSAVETSNAANTETITTDQTFFVLGNNDGELDYSETVVSASINSRAHLGRVWKLDKSASWGDQDVTLCFDGYDDTAYFLVSDVDDFTNVTLEQLLDANGCITIGTNFIPDGSYISLGAIQAGPNCVNGGIALWLRADDGTATGALWEDYSGKGRDATQTGTSEPTITAGGLNFNPVMTFDGTNDYMIVPNDQDLNQNITVFSVHRQSAASGFRSPIGSRKPSNSITGWNYYHDVSNREFWTAAGGLTWSVLNDGAYANNTPEIVALDATLGSGNSTKNIYVNGESVATVANASYVENTTTSLHIGANGDPSAYWNGDIAESIVYKGVLSASERQRVESYLAIKYGITLDQSVGGGTNYLASDGSAYWTNDPTYEYDIAGIGKDDCTALHQKQSKSVNSDAIITMAIGGTLATDNASNAVDINNDKSFLMWANNDGTTTFDQPVGGMGLNSTVHMARIWQVQKTNFDVTQDVTICVGQTGERYLLISSDETFDNTDTEVALDFATGCVTLNSGDLQDDYYFTLGTKVGGPGCVDPGILAWYRADYGTASDVGISDWTDFSGNSQNLNQATGANQPALVDNGINFNPALDFDGSNDFYSLPTLYATDDQMTAFFVTRTDLINGSYQALAEFGNDRPGLYWRGGAANLYAFDVTAPTDMLHPTVYTAQDPTIFMYAVNNDDPKDFRIAANASENTYAGADGTFGLGTGFAGAKLGGINSGSGVSFNGYMSEVVFYEGNLTDAQKRQVYSYFAIKYGITLDVPAAAAANDYIASDGSTVIWSAVDNYDYRYDIAGLGKDECTELHQKQSKSQNSDAILTVALGSTIAASNGANGESVISDNTYFVWGNNNGTFDFNTFVSSASVNTRLDRLWRVDKSDINSSDPTSWGDVDITMCFDGYDTEHYLVINSNASFPSGTTEHQLDGSGCVTLNTGDFNDGDYFSLAKSLIAPACVTGGIQLWLKGDDGTALGNMTAWNDFSQNGGNATTVASDPELIAGANALNHNPVVRFDGNDGFQGNFGSAVTTNQAYAFVVGKMNTASASSARMFSTATAAGTDIGNAQSMSFFMRNGSQPHQLMNRNGTFTQANNTVDDFHLYAGGTGSAGTQLAIRVDGANVNTNAFASTAFNMERFGIGQAAQGGTFMEGDIAEVILYSTELTATDRQKVESYLALKYGFTLDQTTNTDYVASDWDGSSGTKSWTNDDDGFEYDIAGIGKDLCTDLDQKQSSSLNDDDLVTIALGSLIPIPADNASNGEAIDADLSFLSWANNDAGIDNFSFGVGSEAAPATARMPRVWKVDKTANWVDENITICFQGQIGERYLLVDDSDANLFSVDLVEALDINTGCVVISTADLPDGAYFSLGTRIDGPNCVGNDGSIRAWLRGDYGATVGNWNDFSGQTNHGTQATIAQQPAPTATMNYNPAFEFDGGDFLELPLNITPNTTDPLTVFIAYEADATDKGLWGNGDGGITEDRYLRMQNVANGTGSVAYVGGNVTSTIKLNSVIMNEEATAGPLTSYVYVDGAQVLNFNQNASQGGLSSLILGNDKNNTTGAFDGRIAEFAVYSGALSAMDRRQVESYFALRYGISLDVPAAAAANSYFGSDGSTIWSAVDNFDYRYGIAGLGRDACTELHQKQTHTATSNGILTVATGSTIAANNIANANSIVADQSYFIWGHNNGATSFSNAIIGTNVNSRTGRIWKMDVTNWTDQNITMCFDGFDDATYLVVSTTDAAFGAVNIDAEEQLDVNGCVTLNSSILPDGAFFTLATDLDGPACVNPGIAIWLRADDGSVTGAAWADQSGNGFDFEQGTMALQPATSGLMNFNTALTFSNHEMISTMTTDEMGITNSDFEIIAVGRTGTNGTQYLFSSETNEQYEGHTNSGLNGWRFIPNTGVFSDQGANNAYTNGLPHIFGGKVESDIALTHVNNALGSDALAGGENATDVKLKIGRRADTSFPWMGEIAEYIVYTRALTTTERAQVNAYLAYKYGITLNSGTVDYVASNSLTEMWDKDADATYIHDIAGIGRDDCTNLNQKQSKSVNSDAIITMGLGSIEASNAANGNSFAADFSFLSWSNNNDDNGTIEEITTEVPTSLGIAKRLDREWRIHETGSVGDVALQFDLSSLSISATIANQLALLIDDDGDFSNGGTTKISVDDFTAGVATINAVDFSDGDYFTLATIVLEGPACVDDDVRLWLKADVGVTETLGAVSAWNDQSGNENDAAQSTGVLQPSFTASGINFNPAITFDGTTDFLNLPDAAIPAGNSNYTMLAVALDHTNGGFILGGGTANANEGQTLAVQGGNTLQDNWNSSGAATTGTVTDGTPFLITSTYNGTAGGRVLYLDGNMDGTNAALTRNYVPNSNTVLGADKGAAAGFFDGDIAEVIIYSTDITNAERMMIQTYLAIKYGITLNHNYLASDGSTTIWTLGGGFDNDIAGIGRDECDTDRLHQKQSKSSNADALVTMGNVAIAADNASNANAMTDETFLLWGNDDGAIAWQSTESTSPQRKRLTREWVVAETGTVGTVKLQIPDDGSSLTTKLPTEEMTVYLWVDDDGDFTNATEYAMTLNGTNWEVDYDFSDGEYFTFATVRAGIVAHVWAYLQGAYDTSSGKMRTDLASAGVIPMTDPYTELTPVTVTATINPNTWVHPMTSEHIVDWVLIELRDKANSATVIDQLPCFLLADGKLVDADGEDGVRFLQDGDSYFVSIRHRNHLGTMTSTNMEDFTDGEEIVDFREDTNVDWPSGGTYGTNALHNIPSTNRWALWAGDVNGDGTVKDNAVPSDAQLVKDEVITHPNNPFPSAPVFIPKSNAFVISNVYSNHDVDMDASVRDNAVPSDAQLIKSIILLHPSNPFPSAPAFIPKSNAFVITGQLP